MTDRSLKPEFETSGRIWLRNALPDGDLALFDNAVAGHVGAGQRLDRSDALAASLSADGALLRAVRRLAPEAVPVRIVAFNKSETANWGVPWHQDRVIAVAGMA